MDVQSKWKRPGTEGSGIGTALKNIKEDSPAKLQIPEKVQDGFFLRGQLADQVPYVGFGICTPVFINIRRAGFVQILDLQAARLQDERDTFQRGQADLSGGFIRLDQGEISCGF